MEPHNKAAGKSPARRQKSAIQARKAPGRKQPPPTFQLKANTDQQGGQAAQFEKDQPAGGDKQKTAAPQQAPGQTSDPLATVKQKIINGEFKGKGQYSYEEGKAFKFENSDLQAAFDYLVKNWAPGISLKNPVLNLGDSAGRGPDGHPDWVGEFTDKLVVTEPNANSENFFTSAPKARPGKPAWNLDSRLAQRVIEAFNHAWFRKISEKHPDKRKQSMFATESDKYAVPSNVAELFERVGASENNQRAKLLGQSKAEFYGWCGHASTHPVALALLKNKMRFRTGPPVKAKQVSMPKIKRMVLDESKPQWHQNMVKRNHKLIDEMEERNRKMNKYYIALAMKQEIRKQSTYFLGKWAKKKNKHNKPYKPKQAHGVGNKAAHTAPLHPGDHISIVLGASPLSGHVATVIKEVPVKDPASAKPGEVFSKIFYASGNSRGSSVRVEMVQREMPHQDYSWGKTAKVGNKHSLLREKVRVEERKANKAAASVGGGLKKQLMSALINNRSKHAELRQKVGGFYYIVQKYFYSQPAKIRQIYQILGLSPAAYNASLNSPEVKAIKEAEKKRDDYEQTKRKEGEAVNHFQKDFNELNKGGKAKPTVGRFKPLQKSHGWVVSIVRSSLLDTNRIEQEILEKQLSTWDPDGDKAPEIKKEVLAEYDLESMDKSLGELYPGAFDYWEKAGGAK